MDALSLVPQSVDIRSHCSSPFDNCAVLRRHASSSLHWQTSRMHSLLAVRQERDLAIVPNRETPPDFFWLVNREKNDNEQIDLDQLPSREGNRAAGAPYASGISRIPVRMNTLNDGRNTSKGTNALLTVSDEVYFVDRWKSVATTRVSLVQDSRNSDHGWSEMCQAVTKRTGNENECSLVHR